MRMKTGTQTDCTGSMAQRTKGWIELAGIQSRMGEQSYRICRKTSLYIVKIPCGALETHVTKQSAFNRLSFL